MNSYALIRLMQLVSPTLPVGAYAYSGGLEQAVALGWVSDEGTARDWIEGVARHSLCRLDVPVVIRLWDACSRGDREEGERWSEYLLASRESRELQLEDEQLGRALARLADDLGTEGASALRSEERVPFAAAFALMCCRWEIPRLEASLGYVWMWVENQVAAAIKLIPLGQTAGQRILCSLGEKLPRWVDTAATLSDVEIGATLPGLALVSGLHETQYCRLFRS